MSALAGREGLGLDLLTIRKTGRERPSQQSLQWYRRHHLLPLWFAKGHRSRERRLRRRCAAHHPSSGTSNAAVHRCSDGPCTPARPRPGSAALGEELVVGVLVLDVLPYLDDLAVADVERQDLSILQGPALALAGGQCRPTVCWSSATTSCSSARNVPAVSSMVLPKNPRTASTPRWSPASRLWPGSARRSRGRTARRVSMSPLANAS
jgi:hypothetical protein